MRHRRFRLVHAGVVRRRHSQSAANSLHVKGMIRIDHDSSLSFVTLSNSFQLNTSGLGEIKPFGRKQKRAIGDLVDSATDAAQDGAKAGVDAAQDLGNAAASAAGGAIADAINLKDFYSAHLMTFCQGDFKPDAKDPDASEDVSECSERQASFVFDPEAIFSSILPNGVSLSDLGWPDELTTAMESVKTATRAMYFFYMVGISMAGIAMIGAVFGILAYERTVAMANLGVNVVGFFPCCRLPHHTP